MQPMFERGQSRGIWVGPPTFVGVVVVQHVVAEVAVIPTPLTIFHLIHFAFEKNCFEITQLTAAFSGKQQALVS